MMILKVKHFIKDNISKLDSVLVMLFSHSRFTSGLYYIFFSKEFGREQQAVLKGRLRYKTKKTDNTTIPVLRRNIHRIEKGLIMRPRKSTFGKAYIELTMNAYEELINSKTANIEELKWSYDVLSTYFSVVEINGKIERLFKKFQSLECTVKSKLERKSEVSGTEMFSEKTAYSPYSLDKRVTSNISYDDYLSLVKQRRSVRWFEDKKVDMSCINKAIDAASFAPSACNRQPFRFISTIVPDNARHILECANGTAGFAHNSPAAIAVVGDLSNYPLERDRHLIYIDGSLASMQLMLAFETIGLTSCPINWPDIESNEKKIESLLRLEKHERVIMLIAVGYGLRDGCIPYSQKKNSSLLNKEYNKNVL